MSSTEDKKRLSGTKVLAIANKFQSKPYIDSYSSKSNAGFDIDINDISLTPKESAAQVTVVRTESHVARFNNARALFEKLGEESKTNYSKEQMAGAGNMHGLRSRSTLINSSAEEKTPSYFLRTNSSLLQCSENIKNRSISISALSAEHKSIRKQIGKINLEDHISENELVDQFKIAEQSDKKLNSKELIQKQKNWTSHFSKTRTDGYNSDPKKVLVHTSLNKVLIKNNSEEGLQNSLEENYKIENKKLFITKLAKNIDFAEAAERLMNLNVTHTSSKISSTPPPLPIRNSSNCIQKINEPISTFYTENNKSLKYSKSNELSNDFKNEIPEYAVVQKNGIDKKTDNFVATSLTKFQIESTINLKNDEMETYDYTSQLSYTQTKQSVENNKQQIFSTIKSPPKTSEWKNKWLTTNKEILNGGPQTNAAQKSLNENDNYILSNSSLPLKENNEKNDVKDNLEKLINGKNSHDLDYNRSRSQSSKTEINKELSQDTENLSDDIYADTLMVNKKQISSYLMRNKNNSSDIFSVQLYESNKTILNFGESLDQNLIDNQYTNLSTQQTMNESDCSSYVFKADVKDFKSESDCSNKFDNSSIVSDNYSNFIYTGNSVDFTEQSGVSSITKAIEGNEKKFCNDNLDISTKCITNSHLEIQNDIEIQANDDNLVTIPLAHITDTIQNFSVNKHESGLNSLCVEEHGNIFHNVANYMKEHSLAEGDPIDDKALLKLNNKPDNINNCQNSGDVQDTAISLLNPLHFSKIQNHEDNLSLRSRSDFTVDTLSESHVGSVTSSESDILGSTGSLNDTQIDTETESLDYTPLGKKIILVENGVHYFEDGHFWMEVAGIPESEEDDEDNIESFARKTAVSFDAGPIRIYSTHSVNEYDRRNEDVDPVAASAEYELEKRVEKMEVFPVELMKGPDGLGLSIIGMGVGADAGLEKLGIFVKTITESGAAAQEGKIQVNDQIVEVDGKSLVGVTQAYAASVLRNTSGLVRFVIGRERDPKNSEVAMLIKQSLQADKEREQNEVLRNNRRFIANEPVLSEHHLSKEKSENMICSNIKSETLTAEMPMSSWFESESSQSPINSCSTYINSQCNVISSSLSNLSSKKNEMDTLRILLQELIDLENNGASIEEYAAKLRESGIRLHESEQTLNATRQDLAKTREMIMQLTNQNAIFQQKYARARKTARELRVDITSRDEFYQQLLQEKDTEYNALVKSLKDRVIILEVELTELQKKCGMPVRLPYDSATSKIATPQISRRRLLPLPSSIDNQLSDTDTSDLSSPEDKDKTDTVERKVPLPIPVKEELDQAIPCHSLLDNSVVKSKAVLVSRGGLANRHLPRRCGGLSNSSSEYGLDESEDNTDEESSSKNENSSAIISKPINSSERKKILNTYLNNKSTNLQKSKHFESTNPSIIKQHSTISSQVRAMTERSLQTPLKEKLNQVFIEKEQRLDTPDSLLLKVNEVDFNNTIDPESSQTNMATRNLVDEIRHAVSEASQRGITKKGVINASSGNIPWLYKGSSSSSVSSAESTSHSITETVEKNKSGMLLHNQDIWITPDIVTHNEDDNKTNIQYQTLPINDWSKEHVYDYLVSEGLNDLAMRIIKEGITGSTLLRLESRDLKALNIHGNEKMALKRKVKELRIQLDRERKEKKEMERLKKKAEKILKKK